jgi:hypothetical protein
VRERERERGREEQAVWYNLAPNRPGPPAEDTGLVHALFCAFPTSLILDLNFVLGPKCLGFSFLLGFLNSLLIALSDFWICLIDSVSQFSSMYLVLIQPNLSEAD